MRYLIAFLVLALAVPAVVHGACPADKELKADYDSELPAIGGQYGISSCDSLSWTFAFTRTSETDKWTVVLPKVVGTTMRDVEVDSRDYEPSAHHQVTGTAGVFRMVNRLRIDIARGSSCGHFIDMELQAHYFNR